MRKSQPPASPHLMVRPAAVRLPCGKAEPGDNTLGWGSKVRYLVSGVPQAAQPSRGWENRPHVFQVLSKTQHWRRLEAEPCVTRGLDRSSHCGAMVNEPNRYPRGCDSVPGTLLSVLRTQGSSIAVSCGGGHRHGSDRALLWLWYRPAVPAAPI